MLDKSWKAYARYDLSYLGYEVLIKMEDSVVLPVEMTLERKEAGVLLEPSLRLDENLAQQLLNALWEVGLRPRNGESSLAHVEAMRYHLEDMRKLVFDLPKK